jgi:hypothetical protein
MDAWLVKESIARRENWVEGTIYVLWSLYHFSFVFHQNRNTAQNILQSGVVTSLEDEWMILKRRCFLVFGRVDT